MIAELRRKETGASAKAKLWIDDKSQTLPEMMSRIIEWKNKHDMQLLMPSEHGCQRVQVLDIIL